jgi:hypothetical protein
LNRALGCVVLAVVGTALAQGSGREARLLPLTAAQSRAAADRIAAGKDASGAIPDVEARQSFVLRAPGAEDLTLVPGELQVEHPVKPAETQQQCGLFQLDAQGKAVYVSVVGPDFKPYSWCERLQGLGLAGDPGVKPRLIAVYELRAASGNHYDMPFVLGWSAAQGDYQVDYPTSFWLVKQPGGSTIAGARRLLRNRQ